MKSNSVSLFPCPACGRKISSQAKACPGCGQPAFEYCSAEVISGWNGGPIEGRGQKDLDRLLQEGWEIEDESYSEEEGSDDRWFGIRTCNLRRSLLRPR